MIEKGMDPMSSRRKKEKKKPERQNLWPKH